MKEIRIDKGSHFDKYNSYGINYCNSLKESNYSFIEVKFFKKNISLFLEELKKKGDGSTLNWLDSNFINNYLLDTLPKRFPEYSSDIIVKVHRVLKNFIIYFSFQKVLKKQQCQEILRNLYDSKELKSYLNQKSKSEKIYNSDVKYAHNKEIIKIKNKLLHFCLNYGDYLEKHRECEVFNYIDNIEESLLVKAIMDLLENIEDNKIFMKLLAFIDNSMKINSLPSRVIDLLHKKTEQDSHFYRLLLLYQSFFFSGYVLKKPYVELINELELDPEKVGKEIIKIAGIQDLDEIAKNEEIRQELKDIFDIESLIDEITPFSDTTPFSNLYSGELFNFPKGINIDIKKHLVFLEDIDASPEKRIKFMKSNYGKFPDYFSKSRDKKIIQNALNYYDDGKYKEALVALNKLIEFFPENAVPIYLRAKVREAQGFFFDALKDVLKSLELDPFKIEAYMDLSYILEIGGYFYSSTVLTCQLMRFCPFDFNFHLQLAITSYQLSNPYKNSLRLAGKMDFARLLNFISRYWVHDKIRPRDSLNYIKMTNSQFKEVRMSVERIILKAVDILDEIPKPFEENIKKVRTIIRDPSYFFPDKSDYILKNWFIYELTQRLVYNFYHFYFNLTPIIASEKFIQLCFEISKIAAHFVFPAFKARTIVRINIIEELFKYKKNNKYHYYIELLIFFTSSQEVFLLINDTMLQLIDECRECPNQCLIKPNKWCLAFYEFGSEKNKEFNEHYNLLSYLDCIISDLEYNFEEKGLLKKTIDKKVENVEILFSFLINNRKINDPEELEEILNKDLISEFLCNTEVTTSKTLMKQMCISLKNLISLLYHDYGFYQDGYFSKLNKLLTNSDYFLECLEKNN